MFFTNTNKSKQHGVRLARLSSLLAAPELKNNHGNFDADAMRDLFEKQTPTLLSWLIYISIDFMVRPSTPYTSRTTGRFVVIFFVVVLEASLLK